MRSYKQAKETRLLATAWRSLTSRQPPVHLGSESERTLAPRHFKSEQECLTGSFPSSPQFRGGVLQLSWGKPGLEVKPRRPATARQAEGDHVTTSETSIRLHRAAGHPLLSEEARLVSNPHATRLSNNSIRVPSAGQVYAKLPKKPNEVITPWIRLQNQEETKTAAA